MVQNETIVRNVKTGVHENSVYIGRPSLFGNPFTIGFDGDRRKVISDFTVYFYDKLAFEDEFRQKVHELAGKTLLCYCYPKACHGDVIADYLNNRAKIGK
jgi:hypothetical protein